MSDDGGADVKRNFERCGVVIGNIFTVVTFDMTPNRRIFLNIVATYGRSLYALVCGLFISRWVLAALGKTDFGLYGVVGGMTVIVMMVGAWWKCCGDASGTPGMV